MKFDRTLLTLSFAASLLLSLHAVAAPSRYTMSPKQSTMGFTFVQAGAKSSGNFRDFDVKLALAQSELATSSLDVVVNVTSIDTQDAERDDTLRGADLFAVAKFPQAHFTTTKLIAAGPNRYQAYGRLTIRDVTRDVTLPFTFETRSEAGRPAGYMKGSITIRRLDFGVGQGEWKSSEWVGNDVTVSFNLRMLGATS